MRDDALPDLTGEVESLALLLQLFDGSEALLRMAEALQIQIVKELFAHVTEWGVPEVVAQGNSLGEVLVQVESACDRPRYLRHLQRVCQPSDVVVAGGRDKHLGLVFEAPERQGVDNPVAVPLKLAAQRGRLFRALPNGGARFGRVG